MALTGTYERSLDDKQRVAIPKRLRDDFGDEHLRHLFLAPGTERSLLLYSPQEFDLLAARLAGRPSHQQYMRVFYAAAERVDLDSQGRIRLPDRLVQHAGLEHDLFLIGVRDHAEIWSKKNWEQYFARESAEFDRLAREALNW